jgi:hypothetical protein
MVTTSRYPGWESYGKAMLSLTSDPTAQKMSAEATAAFKLESRTVVSGIDL